MDKEKDRNREERRGEIVYKREIVTMYRGIIKIII